MICTELFLRFTSLTRHISITPASSGGSHRVWANTRSSRRSGSAALGRASYLWRSPPATLTGNFEPLLRLAKRLPRGWASARLWQIAPRAQIGALHPGRRWGCRGRLDTWRPGKPRKLRGAPEGAAAAQAEGKISFHEGRGDRPAAAAGDLLLPPLGDCQSAPWRAGIGGAAATRRRRRKRRVCSCKPAGGHLAAVRG